MPEYAVCQDIDVPAELTIKPVGRVVSRDLVWHTGNHKDCVTFLARQQGKTEKGLKQLPPEK